MTHADQKEQPAESIASHNIELRCVVLSKIDREELAHVVNEDVWFLISDALFRSSTYER